MAEEIKRAGQPTKFREEYIEQAYKLCLLGATTKEIADFFDVEESTVHNWMNNHPKFLESIKAAKAKADSEVVRSLYHRALGYSHPETHICTINGKVVKTEITKHYPPDTTACIFWLKNRQPKQWRDKVQVSTEIKFTAADLEEIEQSCLEAMAKARARQEAILLERGITLEEQQSEE